MTEASTALHVKIFADGADLAASRRWRRAADPGLHDQPDADAQGGRRGLRGVRPEVIELVPDRPISFEVFADDFDEMERQARMIASWGANVYVKIPVTTHAGADGAAHAPGCRRRASRSTSPR